MTDTVRSTRRPWLVLFVLMMAGFAWYGISLQMANDRDRADAAVVRYETCLNTAMILTQYNEQQAALADVDRRALTRSTDQELIALYLDRINIYKAGWVDLPDCEAIKP